MTKKAGSATSERWKSSRSIFPVTSATDTYKLTRYKTLYTKFAPALLAITTSEAGPVYKFVNTLQQKLNKALRGEPVADSLIAGEALE
jgi:hypothetical protein